MPPVVLLVPPVLELVPPVLLAPPVLLLPEPPVPLLFVSVLPQPNRLTAAGTRTIPSNCRLKLTTYVIPDEWDERHFRVTVDP